MFNIKQINGYLKYAREHEERLEQHFDPDGSFWFHSVMIDKAYAESYYLKAIYHFLKWKNEG